MKTDVIKEALESVKKEDPKLYEDVVEYISSNRNKTGVHPKGVYQEHSWPNIIGPMPGPFPHPRNPFEQNPLVYFFLWQDYISSISLLNGYGDYYEARIKIYL